MRLLLAFVVILALTLTLWVFVGGVPLDIPTTENDDSPVTTSEGSVSLADSQDDPAVRAVVKAEEMIHYCVVDGETGEGLPHAEIYAIKTGELLAECDADGRTELSNKDPGQLYYLAEGYLLGFFLPDGAQLAALLAQAKAKDVTIELCRDELSFVVEFDFRLPDGENVEGVEFLLELQNPDELAARFVKDVQSRSASTRRAWDNEWKAGSLPAYLKAVPSNPRKAVRLRGARQRLYLAGDYRIAAIAEGGWRLVRESWISPETGSLKLTMNQGNTIAGQVFDGATGEPMSAVLIELNGAPLGGIVKIGADDEGRFSFGSLGTDPKRLRFWNPFYEETVMPEVMPGSQLSISMNPLPEWVIRGKVVIRGSGLPVAGAMIKYSALHEARTDNYGFFSLTSRQRGSETLSIKAPGFFWTSVTVGQGSELHMYSLVPDQRRARVAAGLTSLLSGSVRQPGGKPAAGMDLRLSVEDEKASGVTGLEGVFQGPFLTPGEVTCDADGNFTIECGKPGLISLQPMDGESPPFTIQVALGQRYENLVIYTKN